jgi:hypothetical protein
MTFLFPDHTESILDPCWRVTKIALSVITPILAGKPHLKFTPMSGGLKMQVRGANAVQIFWLYTTRPEDAIRHAILTDPQPVSSSVNCLPQCGPVSVWIVAPLPLLSEKRESKPLASHSMSLSWAKFGDEANTRRVSGSRVHHIGAAQRTLEGSGPF